MDIILSLWQKQCLDKVYGPLFVYQAPFTPHYQLDYNNYVFVYIRIKRARNTRMGHRMSWAYSDWRVGQYIAYNNAHNAQTKTILLPPLWPYLYWYRIHQCGLFSACKFVTHLRLLNKQLILSVFIITEFSSENFLHHYKYSNSGGLKHRCPDGGI